jgi:hypothetical protein
MYVSVEDKSEQLRFIVGSEQSPPGQHFPQHNGGSVYVRLPCHGAGGDLLRRHIREFAFELAFAGRLDPTGCLRDTEVEDPGNSVGSDEYILRRNVPVHDLERLADFAGGFVSRVKATQHACRDGRGDTWGHPLPELGQRPKQSR